MARGKLNPVARGERKLAKAQAALRDALAKDAKAEQRGKKEIDKVRARAEQWRARAQSRVQQRQKAVAQAEMRLFKIKGQPAASAPELLVAPASNDGLTEREAQVLEALRLVSQDGGAVPSAWQRASRLSNGTFSRVRQALMDRGVVIREGDGHRGIRYVLAQNKPV